MATRDRAGVRDEVRHQQLLFDTMLQGVVFQDAEGSIVSMNPAAERILGRTRDEFLGQTSVAVERDTIREDGSPFPRLDHPSMVALRTGREQPDVVMGVFNPRENAYRWISISAVPLFRPDEAKPYQVYTLFHDITDRKRMQSMQAWLATFPERNPNPIVEVDVAGHVSYLNPAARGLFPDLEEKELGHPWLADWHEAVRTLREGGARTPLRVVTVSQTKYEQVMYYVPEADRVRVYGVDVTDRNRAEDALHASELRFRSLFESMDEGFALCEMISDERGSPADFRYLEVNPAFARLTGLAVHQVVGHRARELFPGIEPHWIEAYARVVRSGQSERVENHLEDLGKYYEVYAWRSDPGRFAVVFSDVTERKRADDALREADRRKTEFLGMLSHELRNPLAPIRNALWLLGQAAAGGQQAARAREIIDRQILHLTRIVDDLLDVTRISRGKIHIEKTRVDLVELVRRTVEDHHTLFTANDVALQLELAALPLWIEADATRIEQTVGNVLSNAAKFSDPGGCVTVRVERHPARMALVSVKDHGVGIPADLLPRIFEPFIQADTSLDRSRGGLGLGLSLAKGLVELHAGSIEVRSDGPGCGAEFIILLPLAAEQLASPDAARRTRGVMAHRRVLVIEDSVDAADTLREVLLTCGHAVELAHDGRSGLERARAFRPEVILCDIGLPELDGYEVARAIRSDPVLGSTYLVAVTGYASAEDQRKAASAGFNRHLAKPVSIDAIEEAVATAP